MKKTAIISDIHANKEALEAVLADIKKRGIERIVCLGDIVGYGANPKECIKLIQEHCELIMCGNHDYAAHIIDGTLGFGEHAYDSAQWTRKKLFPKKFGLLTIPAFLIWLLAKLLYKIIWWLDDKLLDIAPFGIPLERFWQKLDYTPRKDRLSKNDEKTEKLRQTNPWFNFLCALPQEPIVECESMFMHASPRDPLNEYLRSPTEYFLALSKLKSKQETKGVKFAFVGHTHHPGVYLEESSMLEEYAANNDVDAKSPLDFEQALSVTVTDYFELVDGRADKFSENKAVIPKDADVTVITNVGSVGQPRDNDNRASYVVFEETADSHIIQNHRVEYDIKSAANKIKKAKYGEYCENQADRLMTGK